MEKLRKIASFLLLPVMFISFTGAEIHFHFCRGTGNFYSNLYLADFKIDPKNASCCIEEPDMNETCCLDTCAEENDPNETCCIDLQQEIITDENYKSSVFTVNITIAELDLHYANALKSHPEFSLHRSNLINNQPSSLPPIDSLTVLIL